MTSWPSIQSSSKACSMRESHSVSLRSLRLIFPLARRALWMTGQLRSSMCHSSFESDAISSRMLLMCFVSLIAVSSFY